MCPTAYAGCLSSRRAHADLGLCAAHGLSAHFALGCRPQPRFPGSGTIWPRPQRGHSPVLVSLSLLRFTIAVSATDSVPKTSLSPQLHRKCAVPCLCLTCSITPAPPKEKDLRRLCPVPRHFRMQTSCRFILVSTRTACFSGLL